MSTKCKHWCPPPGLLFVVYVRRTEQSKILFSLDLPVIGKIPKEENLKENFEFCQGILQFVVYFERINKNITIQVW